MSFSAVTCQACPVKARCTKREKHKGRILTLSPQPIHEARERRRAEQATSALRASLCLAGRHRRHDFRRPSLSWDAPGALSWSAKDAAASPGHRGSHQLGPHPSDAATHAAWTLAPTQASFVSFCTFATALGDMMSGQNFPAESFIHPYNFGDACLLLVLCVIIMMIVKRTVSRTALVYALCPDEY